MIKFEYISFKNILHFGNSLTRFDFPDGITRIIGPNGAGKSTLLDAFNFVLFGKPYRKINLNQLINNINNKELYVETAFVIKSDRYLIKRGIKPNIFEIYKNDELIPLESLSLSYQNLLETKILYMNEDIFNQTVIKSMTKDVSFTSLSKQNKRELIEKLFNLDVFFYMKEILNEIIYNNKIEISNLSSSINNLKLLIKREEEHIEEIKKIQEEIIKNKETELKEKLIKISDKLQKIEEYKPKLAETQEKLKEEISKLESIKKEIISREFKIKDVNNKKKQLKSICSDCPKVEKLIEGYSEETIQKEINEYKVIKGELESNLETLETQKSKLLTFLNNETGWKNIETETKKELEFLTSQEPTIYDESKLEEYKEELKEVIIKYNTLFDKNNHYLFLKELIQKDTIKNFIILQYLPLINKILQTYLEEFNLGLKFKLDSEFSLEPLSRYSEKLSYYNLSEGEKSRVNLSITFTLLDFLNIKNKYSQCNLLFLDEISAGLDANSRLILGDILKRKSEKIKIFLIDHTIDDSAFVDNVFGVKLKNGFSSISTE